MLHTPIFSLKVFLVLEKKILSGFLPYMGMMTILFNGVEPFEQTVNIPSTEDSVKIGQAVSEKKMFNDYIILNMYIAHGQGRITARGQNLIANNKVNYTLQISAITQPLLFSTFSENDFSLITSYKSMEMQI